MFQFHNIYMSAGLQGLVGSVSLTNGGNYTSPPTGITFSGGGGTGAAASMTIGNGFHTGPVTSISQPSGVYYAINSATPTVSFSGGGGSSAVATCSDTGVLYSVALTNDGGFYMSGETAHIIVSGGGGTGASVIANMGWRTATVTGITGGSGVNFTSTPTVTVTCGYGQVSSAVITPILSGGGAGTVTGYTIAYGGEYYCSPNGQWAAMNVTISNGSQSTTANVITMNALSYKVSNHVMGGAFFVVQQGSGFTSTPTITIVGANGGRPNATGTATVMKKLISINLLTGGYGYSSPPTVTLSPAVTTTTCTVDAGTSYYVTSIFMTNMGSGYTSTPTVNIVGGSGSVATAIANLI